MPQSNEPGGARFSPAPPGGIAAKRPPRKLSPTALAARARQVARDVDPVVIEKGTMIGEYVVEKRLDEGGMGTVYAAVHPVIHKRVAIKVLHPHVARQEEAVARFIQEARAVNAIGHPGIVDIFGFGRFIDGRHYITMEYLEGKQLLAYLNARGPIPPLEMLQLAKQLGETLTAAHEKGVVHRDMKPENVFLAVSDKPGEEVRWPPKTKILDFGLAKLIEAELSDQAPHTRAGVTVGTPYYMSPEQCRGKPVDFRADVYALGVMMYEMVTGRVPFYAAESVDVLYMHLTQEPELPSKHRPVHPEIEALILRCMAKKPETRPQSMRSLVTALDELLGLLLPSPDTNVRPEEDLVAEAEAFFGGRRPAPGHGSRQAHATLKDQERLTVPPSDAGFPVSDSSAVTLSEVPQVAPDIEASLAARDAQATEETASEDPAEGGGPAAVSATARPPLSTHPSPGPSVPSLPSDPLAAEATSAAVVASGPSVPSLPSDPTASVSRPAPALVPGLTTSDPYQTPLPAVASIRAAGEIHHDDVTPPPVGFQTVLTDPVIRLRPKRAPLWVAIVIQAVVIVLLVGVVLLQHQKSSSRSSGRAAAAPGVKVGGVELRSRQPVDVTLNGKVLAKQVKRLLVVRLSAGSAQTFLITRPDGQTHRIAVTVVADRIVRVDASK